MTHTEPDYEFNYFTNDAHRAQVKEAIDSAVALLPWWVRRVIVQDQGLNGDAAMSVSVQPNYRHIVLSVYPGFYDSTEQERARYVRHELCHVLLAPLTEWVRERLIAPLEYAEPRLYEYLQQEFIARLECVTEDLAIGRVAK